jgi:hypothetical protein
MLAMQLTSAAQESRTNDESLHLASGYSYLVTGDYRMDPSHPAFARMLAALPLLFMHLDSYLGSKAWDESDDGKYAELFLYHNRVTADTLLLCSRSVITGLTVFLGIWMAWWTRRHFGSAVALLSLAFFTFDPNIIAHGHYVTTDLPVTLFIFLTCTLWAEYLWAPHKSKLLLTAVALGLALTSKYSAVFLIPVLPLTYCLAWFTRRDRRTLSFRGLIVACSVMCLVSTAVMAVVYAPEVIGHIRYAVTGIPPGNILAQPLAAVLSKDSTFSRLLVKAASEIGIPTYRYLIGLSFQTGHNATGHPSYLLGEVSTAGRWTYFPIAFLVKTPTATLLACLLAGVAPMLARRPLPKAALILWISVAPALYLAVSMLANINIGIRHVLPLYPFLYVILAITFHHYVRPMLREWFLLTMVALFALLAAESLATYPDYLSFFNWASGGSDNGSRYLLDSNIDWGQSTKEVAEFLDRKHLYPVCPALFGADQTDLDYYGVGPHIAGWPLVTSARNTNCVAAVSVNFLNGLYVPPKQFALLRQREPDAVIGHAVYIYDLRSKGGQR